MVSVVQQHSDKTGKRKVVVLGASDKPERYSNQAVRLLLQEGYEVIPVHGKLEQIEGLRVSHSLKEIEDTGLTLTIYVSAAVSSKLERDILALAPAHVIFNPGSENPDLYEALDKHGISHEAACTLVLLRTGQF